MDNQQAREVGYLAALLDGEGSLSLDASPDKRGNVRYTPRISVGMTSQATMDKLRFLYVKYEVPYYQTKRVYPEPYLPVYVLEVRRFKYVKRLLELVMDDMAGKKKQAELLIRFVNSRVDENGDVRYHVSNQKGIAYEPWVHDVWQEMRTLNGRNGNRPKKFLSNSKLAKQLTRLNDCTSSCTVEYQRANDTVSPALERCS